MAVLLVDGRKNFKRSAELENAEEGLERCVLQGIHFLPGVLPFVPALVGTFWAKASAYRRGGSRKPDVLPDGRWGSTSSTDRFCCTNTAFTAVAALRTQMCRCEVVIYGICL